MSFLGETLRVPERVIVSPAAGRFFSLPPQTFTTEGEWVHEGQVVGHVNIGTDRLAIVSRFSGWMMGMLTVDGAPVKEGEAVMWLR